MLGVFDVHKMSLKPCRMGEFRLIWPSYVPITNMSSYDISIVAHMHFIEA